MSGASGRAKPARRLAMASLVGLLALAAAPPALADFPYARPGANEAQPDDLYLDPDSPAPNDVGDDEDGEYWKYAASPRPGNEVNDRLPAEEGGIRGARVYDRDGSLPTAWQLTTGRPDVTIAVLDSGIKWNESSAMKDLRLKTRINKGEAPPPEGGCSGSGYDCNGDHVFNVDDYANDPRVRAVLDAPREETGRAGPDGVLTPQDVLIAFSDGDDDDSNGYEDDMVGWDFLDDDNDPYDDVQYGHGTGEAEGSSGEVDNGADTTTGSCPNCMVIHMRVGDSFIADVNRFAAAVTYATDNDVQVVQSALGTLNNSSLARQAVEYAYRHGTTMVLSAADEAAQHNNQPAMPHTILVNSVTRSPVPPPDQSYLAFNGCTNFGAKITVSIPSTSCSSDAVGVGSGLAGLVYSAALNAIDRDQLQPHPDRSACETVDGEPCPITPNEVRQLMASGRIPGIGGGRQSEDVNFMSPTGGPEPACGDAPTPGCTGPYGAANAGKALIDVFRPSLLGGPPVSESYPARRGADQFYGYGRANVRNATEALLPGAPPESSRVPPEAEIRSPEWFEQVDPSSPEIAVEGDVYARGASYRCEVLVAPGQYPNHALAPEGDFRRVEGDGWCDGSTVRSGTEAAELHSGALARIDTSTLKSYFPPGTDFTGSQPEASPATSNGRPAMAPHSFTFKVVVTTTGTEQLSGEDQRAAYLHRDAEMLPGFPRTISEPQKDGAPDFPTGDGESSPAFADLDGDNRNELVYGSSDGLVHAVEPDGTELPGWPAQGDVPSFVAAHGQAPGYASGAVNDGPGGPMLAAVAIGDTNRDGLPEVYAADLEGKVYGFDHRGERIFTEESNPAYSGRPLEPFHNVRNGETNRTQHGFIGSPVLADLQEDGEGDQELIIAGMDRHLYAWDTADADPAQPGGAPEVDGFPVLVVDREKVAAIDPATHRVTFKSDSGSQQQGGMIDTPAVADVAGDSRPEIIVGTNEGYRGGSEPGPNTSAFSNPSFEIASGTGIVEPGNTRLYALRSTGDRDGDPATGDAVLDGWPVPLAFLNAELLPVVGEGVTGYPIVGPARCPNGGEGSKIGAISYAGPGYLLNPDGSSCYGTGPDGTYNTMATDQGASSDAVDHPIIPAVGLPAFGNLAGTGNPSFLAPAAGLQRALDLVLPEYQPASQDYISAWDTSTGQFRPNFPQTQNDLSFLTGPSIADIDGQPGEEVVSGSASMDFNAYTGAGAAVAGWPKLSSDWVVANPLIGSFSERPDTETGVRKVVVGMTRSGYLMAWSTDAPACSDSSWPRFHHDNANSGDYDRDAVAPGTPMEMSFGRGRVTFRAPGDDLLCGTAQRYELATSDEPIDESNFEAATPLSGAPQPESAGSTQSFRPPRGARRYLAVRAVDEQGNVGRVASVELRGSSGGKARSSTLEGDRSPPTAAGTGS